MTNDSQLEVKNNNNNRQNTDIHVKNLDRNESQNTLFENDKYLYI